MQKKRVKVETQTSVSVGCAAMALLCAADMQTARAAENEFNPRIEVGGIYNDNFLLYPSSAPGRIKVHGLFVDAQLELLARSPISEVSLTPRLRSAFYSGNNDYDTNDIFLPFHALHRGQKSQARLM